MADPHGNAVNAMKAPVKGSRIDSDVERILGMARSANSARDRLLKHSSALGYFQDNADAAGNGTVQSISNNLQSALNDLDRSIEGLHGALNLFD